jgi:methionyl-tRNA formyltransferase
LVVVETGSASFARQAVSRVRRRRDATVAICRRHGWRYVRVATVNAEDAIAAVASVDPALAVHAGAGIVRERVLALPRLGTLGAHMGILPAYRGMNVTEWAAFNDDAIGCSVFWLDAGIDTGPVITTRVVDAGDCRSIEDLRARVDHEQLAALDETLRVIVERGEIPAATKQRPVEGRLFFRMHPEIRRLLDDRLRRRRAR